MKSNATDRDNVFGCYREAVAGQKGKSLMTECQERVKELREATGMNRKQFCETFEIPYRTVTEWERGTRNAPKYVLKFLEYYIRMENMMKEKADSEVAANRAADE